MAPQEQETQQITELLIEWNEGADGALERLMPLVEKELRRIAAHHMKREKPGHTLQTTALVNEAYLELVDQRRTGWKNRAHFFALSAQFMRRVLLDHARTRARAKRGGGAVHVDIAEVAVIAPEKSDELLALDEALVRLSEFDPVKARIVEMRHFGGLSVEEVAEVLGVSPVTVIRHWGLAKAWLKRELKGRSE